MAIPLPLAALTSGLAGWLQAGVARSIEAAGESLNEVASRLGAQIDRLGVEQWGAPEPLYDDRKMILTIVVTAIIVGGIVCYAAVTAWRRVQEQRLRLIETLARDGKLDARQLAEQLHPRRRLKLFMVLAWLGLFAGIITLIASGFERGSSQEEMVVAGFGLIVGAIGVLATPIMLRELHRQGVL